MYESYAMAPHAFVPVNSPAMARRLPRLLLSGGSPLSMDWSYAPRMLPWLMRFLRHCTAGEVQRIARTMQVLLARNIEFATPLLKDSGITG